MSPTSGLSRCHLHKHRKLTTCTDRQDMYGSILGIFLVKWYVVSSVAVFKTRVSWGTADSRVKSNLSSQAAVHLPANAQHTHVLRERVARRQDLRVSSPVPLHLFFRGAATQTRKRVALHQLAELETSA